MTVTGEPATLALVISYTLAVLAEGEYLQLA